MSQAALANHMHTAVQRCSMQLSQLLCKYDAMGLLPVGIPLQVFPIPLWVFRPLASSAVVQDVLHGFTSQTKKAIIEILVSE